MKNKKNNYLLITVAVLLLAVIITRGFSHARYASNAIFNYYLSSKGFYFESDDLSFDTKKNIDTMWDGDKVHFSLSNSANGALAAETDISYKVTCVVDEEDTTKECLVNGTGSSEYEATLSAIYGCSDGGTDYATCLASDKDWLAKESTAELYFEVIDSSGADVLNANVLLSVVSTKPYKKELSASYKLIRDNSEIGGLSMEYEEGNTRSILIVTNSYNEDKCVSVSWNASDFAFDQNSNVVLGTGKDAGGVINSAYFKMNKMDSVPMYFYEKDTSVNHSELSFNLVESNLCE
jgi:hypothetical protein